MKKYIKRIADAMIAERLAYSGAILVEGPKWCGKTTTCEQHAKSIAYISDPDMREYYLDMARMRMQKLLEGEQPRLFDEWQEIPELWDAIRFSIDHSEEDAHFLLTGSAVVPKKKREKIRHSGTGRFSRVRMRPMSLWESGESSGAVGISDLFDGKTPQFEEPRKVELEEMAFILCRGGWPNAIGRGERAALRVSRDYCESIIESDASRADDVPRDPARVKRLMRSYARLQGTQTSLAAIRKDMAANDVADISEDTIYSYLDALTRIFVVENVQAWTPSIRAKTAIRSSDTRYFTDPSIATAALGARPGDLMNDLRSFGMFFETLCLRDLRVYMDAHDGMVRHYRDQTGLECDAVLENFKGDYALVEIKLGGERLVSEGIRSLNTYWKLLEGKKIRKPVFRMILTAVGDYAYTRKEDGIIVCPISALKP
jgi:hypothetical protein